MQLDYEINVTADDETLVTLTCHRMTQRATSQPFPRILIGTTLAVAMDQRTMHPRTLDDYSIRFTNTDVRVVKASQLVAEFPILFAPTLIAQARGTEGDLFAAAQQCRRTQAPMSPSSSTHQSACQSSLATTVTNAGISLLL